VGGPTLDAVLLTANPHSRIIACGMISQYGKSEPYGVKNLMMIVGKRIRMEGFIQGDLRGLYFEVRILFPRT
jgi:2-alkenal reductase (NADP+)